MSVAGFAKGVANYFVPVQGSLQRADTYLDAVAGNQNSLLRGMAGIATGLAYGKVAVEVATQMIPESYAEMKSEFQAGHEFEGAWTILTEITPEAAATGLLAANGVASLIRGFRNSSEDSAAQSA
jgi:hypothetical protein